MTGLRGQDIAWRLAGMALVLAGLVVAALPAPAARRAGAGSPGVV